MVYSPTLRKYACGHFVYFAYLRNMVCCGIIAILEVIPVGGKTSTASKNKYNAKAYDRINLTVPKGKKEIIQAHAETTGESVNGFINRAVDEAIERDKTTTD